MTSSTNDVRSMWGWFMRARSMNVNFTATSLLHLSVLKRSQTVQTAIVNTKHSVQNRCKR